MSNEGEIRNDSSDPNGAPAPTAKQRRLSPEARRALQEAAERRATHINPEARVERGGRGGLEPVRFGDWEVKGIASDF